VKGLAKLGQTERVRSGAGEHKINIAIDFEDLPDPFAHRRGPFVIAVRGRVTRIRLLQSCPRLGTNRRRVITRKLVTDRVGTHRASITRVLSTDNQHKRDCLTAEPWASESARQIPPLLLLELRTAVSFSISERSREMSVYAAALFLLLQFGLAAVPVLVFRWRFNFSYRSHMWLRIEVRLKRARRPNCECIA
jgi:hypothetical protein